MRAVAAAYRGLVRAGAPLLRAHLRRRARRGKEDPARLAERFGIASVARPAGPLVWLHAASVGESLALLPLLRRLATDAPDIGMLVTTGTRTSADLLPDRLPPDVVHQYHPLDHPAWVARFLDHWRPGVALFAESEIWPTMLGMAQARGVATGLVNARMSARSFRRWRRVPGLIGPLMAGLHVCLAQDTAQADRLAALGASRSKPMGNLKYAAAPDAPGADALAELRGALNARPRWLAASTHPGEEAAAADVHARLAGRHSGLITLIAPRHPDRADAVAGDLAARGLTVARRSHGETVTPATDIFLLDTLGELNLLTRVCGIAFVGGSLQPHGGHNPIEPAQAGCAILHGPDMTNAQAAADALHGAGGAWRVDGTSGLADAVDRLLTEPATRNRMAAGAREAAAAQQHVLDAVMAELWPCLAAIRPAAAA